MEGKVKTVKGKWGSGGETVVITNWGRLSLITFLVSAPPSRTPGSYGPAPSGLVPELLPRVHSMTFVITSMTRRWWKSQHPRLFVPKPKKRGVDALIPILVINKY